MCQAWSRLILILLLLAPRKWRLIEVLQVVKIKPGLTSVSVSLEVQSSVFLTLRPGRGVGEGGAGGEVQLPGRVICAAAQGPVLRRAPRLV